MAFPSTAKHYSPQSKHFEKRSISRNAKSAAMSQINQLIASGGVPATHPVLPKTSYCTTTLYRIQTMAKAIAQTRKLVDTTKEQLEQRLQSLHRGQSEAKRYQTLRMKVNLLQDQLKRETKELFELRQKRKQPIVDESNLWNEPISPDENQTINELNVAGDPLNQNIPEESEQDRNREQGQDHQQQEQDPNEEEDSNDLWPDLNVERCERMAHCFEQMKRQGQHLKDQQNKTTQDRAELIRLQDLIYLRRKQLCCELLCLFPITGQPPANQSILNIPLPTVDQLANVNDHQVEAALGFVCQILIVLSKLLDVPLRFDLLFHGSQNWIVDKTQPELESYPLFYRNGKRDRARFNYALFLLNRNIAQLCQHFQLPIADLQYTLNNLLSLFRERLIYKKEDLTKINLVLNATAAPNRPETPSIPADLNEEEKRSSDDGEEEKTNGTNHERPDLPCSV